MLKKKNSAAVRCGRKGGLAKVPKGFATMPIEESRRIQSAGGKASKRGLAKKKVIHINSDRTNTLGIMAAILVAVPVACGYEYTEAYAVRAATRLLNEIEASDEKRRARDREEL